MNDREAMICRLKELNYSNTFCALDTLIKIDENVLSCRYCVFNDTKELGYLGCPFNWGCTFGKGNDYER